MGKWIALGAVGLIIAWYIFRNMKVPATPTTVDTGTPTGNEPQKPVPVPALIADPVIPTASVPITVPPTDYGPETMGVLPPPPSRTDHGGYSATQAGDVGDASTQPPAYTQVYMGPTSTGVSTVTAPNLEDNGSVILSKSGTGQITNIGGPTYETRTGRGHF